MFSVDGGTVTVCWTRQCPVVNCSIAEHQQQRRLGHQQLRTATGVSVRTADIAHTDIGTVAITIVVCRSSTILRKKKENK